MSKGACNGLKINEETLPVIESMAEGLPGGFFIYHADCGEEFIYVNTQMLKIMGCETKEEFRKHTRNSFKGLVYADDLDAVEKGIRQQIKNNPDMIDRVNYRVIRTDGKILWIDELGRFVHTEMYGDIFYVFVNDVTDEYNHEIQGNMECRLEMVNALCRDYLSVSLINMQDKNVKLVKLDGNAASGFSKEKNAIYDYATLWERYIEEFVHPEDAAMLADAVQIENLEKALDSDGEYVITYRIIEEGNIHYYQAKFIRLDKCDGVIVSFQNMDAVVEKNLDDAKKLENAKKALEDALAAADTANKAKTDFFFNLSHDIRTPMNVIIGFTDLLSKHEEDRDRRRDYIQKIRESSRYLLELLNNVLEMARIENGKMNLDESVWNPEELDVFLKSFFSDQLKKKNISYVSETDIHSRSVVCDATKVKEIFFNLISNAIKYTPNGGSVSLRVKEMPSDREGYVVFKTVIEDNGIGMSEEFLPHIFEDFSRETASGQIRTNGTGLGMPIVKKMIDLMNGSIEVESELGKGTRITVFLTHKIADETAKEPQRETTNNNSGVFSFRGKRILLAEDNELNAEIAVEILGEMGFQVEHARNGRICVDMYRKADEGYYDLILMDVQMPEQNGYQATREIRNLSAGRKQIPIIAMTANAFEEDKRDALESGMNGHISKPIEATRLLEALAEIF